MDQSSQILVLPHGALLALFSRVTVRADGTFTGSILARRSPNEGHTWRPAERVQSMPLQPFTDPKSGDQLPNEDDTIFTAAVGPRGTSYVAWDQNRSPRSGSIRFTKSTNGGRSWSTPSWLPGVRAFAFQPAIAVDAPNSVGITWYDMRRDQPTDNHLTTDVWFAHTSDGGKTWQQTHVAGPFDFAGHHDPAGSRGSANTKVWRHSASTASPQSSPRRAQKRATIPPTSSSRAYSHTASEHAREAKQSLGRPHGAGAQRLLPLWEIPEVVEHPASPHA